MEVRWCAGYSLPFFGMAHFNQARRRRRGGGVNCPTIVHYFACQLRGHSCTLTMIIPLPPYDNFSQFVQVGGKWVGIITHHRWVLPPLSKHPGAAPDGNISSFVIVSKPTRTLSSPTSWSIDTPLQWTGGTRWSLASTTTMYPCSATWSENRFLERRLCLSPDQ